MRIAKMSAFIMGLLILSTATPGRPVLAQEAEKNGQPLQYEVSVILKLIPVYVTDKKGQPVQDLTPEDFVVSDNGRPMTVTAFEKHTLKPLAIKPEFETLVAEKAPLPRALTRKFFLFFDLAFNNPRGIMKAKAAALHFLEAQVKPDDEVGVLSYSMFKGITIQEFLTTDHEKVREALRGIDQRGIAGRASEIEDWYWRLVQEPLPSGMSEAGGLSPAQSQQYMKEAQAQREESKLIVQRFILRMTDLAKALRYIPGQKHFILFSTGAPSSLIYGSQAGNPSDLAGRSQFDPGDRTIRTQNEDMYREFSASGCTFYAFDTRESAMVTDLFGYDRQTFETGGRGLFSEQGIFQDSTNVWRDERTTGLNSLKRLTDMTGGKYYSNINLYKRNLEQVQTLTGTYYVLGYSIGEKWDGQFHEIKVDVKRKGCEVRAQAGYFNPKPYRDCTNLEKDLQLFDLALNERSFSRMPVNVPSTAFSLGSGSEAGLEILARIPAGVMEEFQGRRVEFVTIVFDNRDNICDIQRMEADPGRYRGRDVVFSAGASLEPGDYKCRLVLRDMETGLSAVASARGSIGPAPPSGLRLLTPLLLARGPGAVLLDTGPRKGKEVPLWTDIYPFDRENLSPVAGEAPKSAAELFVMVPCSFSSSPPPDLAVAAHLIRASSGERMPASFSLLERTLKESMEVLTLKFPIDRLAPGQYLVYIYAQDTASKALSFGQTAFLIPER